MKFKNWLKKWNLSSLKINAEFLEVELTFDDLDKKAAWEMYVELLTRITTQPLKVEDGDEETALKSIYNLFPLTREILKIYGAGSISFAKIAIVILNQIIRPFTAKWHKLSIQGAFKEPSRCIEFRQELEELRGKLLTYARLLSDIAGVEDLTALENE
jgi:hypothetical protein